MSEGVRAVPDLISPTLITLALSDYSVEGRTRAMNQWRIDHIVSLYGHTYYRGLGRVSSHKEREGVDIEAGVCISEIDRRRGGIRSDSEATRRLPLRARVRGWSCWRRVLGIALSYNVVQSEQK
jgi:hypothetical protein